MLNTIRLLSNIKRNLFKNKLELRLPEKYQELTIEELKTIKAGYLN